MPDNTCPVCDEAQTEDRACCRSQYDNVTSVDRLREFFRIHVFHNETGVLPGRRARCFRSNLGYTLQFLEYLSTSHIEHTTQRNHFSILTIFFKQYCAGVFSVAEATLGYHWLKENKRPPVPRTVLTQSLDRGLISKHLFEELEWLRELRNNLHLSKILTDFVADNEADDALEKYDWVAFGRPQYDRAKQILITFLLEVSDVDAADEEFRTTFPALVE